MPDEPTPSPQDTPSPANPPHPQKSPLQRYRPARAGHRARSHESAHHADAAAASATGGASRIPDHPLVPRTDASLITTQAGLLELIAHVRQVGSFAYDSEFIGEMTYVPKLCLVQVASAKRVALVDPLAEIDLTPFWQLVCDPAVEKIVHAGLQDLEPAVRHTGCQPANVFDTQLASGFVGMAYPSALGKLVKELVGAHLGKGLTFTHWDQRPLSAMQLRYAADDVRYLPALRAEIGQRLEARGHMAWAAAECAMLCDLAQYRFDPDVQYRRVRGATSLNPAGLAVLRELVTWRDGAARAHDVPPRAFLKDEILIDLARTPVRTVEKLARVRGLPRPVELAHGKEIIDAIARAAAVPPQEMPPTRQREETPTGKFRADSLWALLEVLCLGRGIDPNLVASHQEVVHLYHHLAGDGSDETADRQTPRVLTGWRRAAVGEALLAIFENAAEARLTWSAGDLRATMDAQ